MTSLVSAGQEIQVAPGPLLRQVIGRQTCRSGHFGNSALPLIVKAALRLVFNFRLRSAKEHRVLAGKNYVLAIQSDRPQTGFADRW